MRTLVLHSGGLDSIAVCRFMEATSREYRCLHVSYGQPAAYEESIAAAEWCHKNGVSLDEVMVTLESSALRGGGPRVVPVRNAALLSVAANWAVALGCAVVAFGATLDDGTHYADCRPAFIEAFSRILTDLAGVTVDAPLVREPKREAMKWLRDGDAEIAWSCYQPVELRRPCGRCNSCRERAGALA